MNWNKKSVTKTLSLVLLLLLSMNVDTIAQKEVEKSKKVTIVTKKIDKNGKKTVEKIVKEGSEIDEKEINLMIEKVKKGDKEVEISINKEATENKKITIITKKIDKNGKEIVEKIVKEGNDISEAEIEQLIEKAKKGSKEMEVRINKEIEIEEDENSKNIWIQKDGKTIVLDELEGENIMILHTEEEHQSDKDEGEMEVTVTVDEDGTTKIVKKRKKAVKKEKSEDVEEKLKTLGIQLPTLGEPIANYMHAVTSNNWVFLAGKGPRKEDGKNITGKLGKDLTVEEGYEAARLAGINLLAALKGEIGDLNRVVRIVKVNGMVNAVPEFTDHSKVINGFSDLMVKIFGDKGRHARAAVGMSSLPGNMAVEIEVVVEIE